MPWTLWEWLTDGDHSEVFQENDEIIGEKT